MLRACLPARSAPKLADKGRQRRELLDWPEAVLPGADHWQKGSAWQVTMQEVPFARGDRDGSGAGHAEAL